MKLRTAARLWLSVGLFAATPLAAQDNSSADSAERSTLFAGSNRLSVYQCKLVSVNSEFFDFTFLSNGLAILIPDGHDIFPDATYGSISRAPQSYGDVSAVRSEFKYMSAEGEVSLTLLEVEFAGEQSIALDVSQPFGFDAGGLPPGIRYFKMVTAQGMCSRLTDPRGGN